MKQVFSSKNLKSRLRLVRQQGGQAVTEYILLLIVSLSLLLAFKEVVTGVDKFMYKYMGEYISCLMEYGELPSQGVENAELKKHVAGDGGGKTCDSKFDSFNLSAGRQASAGKTSTKKSSVDEIAERNKNSSRSAESSSSKTSADSKNDRKKDSISARDKAANSPYSKGLIQRSSGSGASTTADNGSAGADKTRILEQDESDAARRARLAKGSKSNRVVYERSRYKALTGKELQDVEKDKKTERAPTSQLLTAIDESGRIGPRKSIIAPQEFKVRQVAQESDDSMSFGNFFKWLIIAAMVIAIGLFFGSQIMNFMNSQEK